MNDAFRLQPTTTSNSLDIPLIELHTRRRRFHPLRPSSALRCHPGTSTILTATKEHASHHIQQRVALPWDLDCEILLAYLRQGVIPDSDVSDMRCIMRRQLLIQIRTTALNRKEQHADEIQQWQRGEDAYVRASAADILHAE